MRFQLEIYCQQKFYFKRNWKVLVEHTPPPGLDIRSTPNLWSNVNQKPKVIENTLKIRPLRIGEVFVTKI